MFEATLSLNSPDPVETPTLTVDFPEASPMPTPAPPADSPNVPSSLKISPMAVVPQKDRRGRIILDLSFPVYRTRTKPSKHEEPIHASVNKTTNWLAPDKPV
jgi:hypothetical protein